MNPQLSTAIDAALLAMRETVTEIVILESRLSDPYASNMRNCKDQLRKAISQLVKARQEPIT